MKFKFYILIVLFLFVFPICVNAEHVEHTYCFTAADGVTEAHVVNFDDSVNTEVAIDKININNVKNGHLTYPNGISNEDKVKYNFSATRIPGSCWIGTDNKGVTTVYSCPKDSTITYEKITEKYLNFDDSDSIFKNISFSFKNGKFNVVIKDKFNDKLYFRYLANKNQLNDDELNVNKITTGILTRQDDGTYKINNVNGNTSIYIEFYEKSSESCKGAYIGYLTITTPSAYDHEVPNPALSDPEAYGCDLVKNYKPDGMSLETDINTFNEFKKSYISECYSGYDKIKYGLIASLKENIETKLENLQNMFSSYSSTNSNGDRDCDNLYNGGSKIVYSSTGRYWGMVCTESYTAKGDTAKLVKAGEGFSYQSNFNVTRTCNISQISKPTKPQQCTTTITPHCSWTNRNGTTGTGTHAGPNNDFDQCVVGCDNGKYTQECINSCYVKVYGDSRDLSGLDGLSYYNKDSNISFMSSYNSPVFTSPNTSTGCTTEAGNTDAKELCWNGTCTCFSTWCGNHSGSCYFTVTKTPDGCADDPNAVYNAALTASVNELNAYKTIQTSNIDVGEYEYKITDSYLKKGNGSSYVFKVNSSTNPKLNVNGTQSVVSSTSATTSVGNSGAGTNGIGNATYNSTQTNKVDIVVNLPVSYVNRKTAEVVYKNTTATSGKYYVINLNGGFIEKSGFNKNNYFDLGGRKYYTSVLSRNLNVVFDADDKAKLLKNGDYNIKVSSSGVGRGDFSSNIQCYYGVSTEYICDPNVEICPCDPDVEICDGGIQYIYRTIDLTNMFPNRNPRWNWTGTINRNGESNEAALTSNESLYGSSQTVDPEKLIQDIQTKGESIYDVSRDSSEIDYEFVLTKENIRNIRNYNKNIRDYNSDGSKNYLDYNMSCYSGNGRERCYSKFMDNVDANTGSESNKDFITYTNYRTKTMRKKIIGCNNAISGNSCD